MANDEVRRPANWFYNTAEKRWELRGQLRGSPIAALSEAGLNLYARTGTIANLNIGSTAVIQRVAVAGVASLATVNLTTGTMTNINVGSTATAQSIVSNSIALGGGGATTLRKKLTGTGALAAIGTGAMAVATLTGMGSGGIAVGDLVTAHPKAALSGIGIVGVYVPTTNVVNVYVMNPNSQGGGSLPATGFDVLVTRNA